MVRKMYLRFKKTIKNENIQIRAEFKIKLEFKLEVEFFKFELHLN